MPRTRIYHGGCLCGAIRFEAEGPIAQPHSCSCRMCQRHSGALTAIWVELPQERLRWTGPRGTPRGFRSSSTSSRAFCPDCGSSLGALDDNGTIALLLGAFDTPHYKEFAAGAHSYITPRPKWWQVHIAT